MVCKCLKILNNIKEVINAKRDSIIQAWEQGEFYAVEEMDDVIIKIRNIMGGNSGESYERCGCFDGIKLSKIKNIIASYEENKDDARESGGEHFIRMTKQGAYTEVLQIINE